MAITLTITDAQGVLAVGAIETQISKYEKFCHDTDEKWGAMNNLHKHQMRNLLDTRDTFVEALRQQGYNMLSVETYDTAMPEWTIIEDKD